MEDVKHTSSKPIGPKIAKIRSLRGWNQVEFGEKLGGMSKSAVSRLEKSVELESEVLQQVCDVLEVTVEGLKSLDEDSVLHMTANYFENCTINAYAGNSGNAPHSTFNFNSIEEISKFYEKQLEEIKAELKRELGKVK